MLARARTHTHASYSTRTNIRRIDPISLSARLHTCTFCSPVDTAAASEIGADANEEDMDTEQDDGDEASIQVRMRACVRAAGCSR